MIKRGFVFWIVIASVPMFLLTGCATKDYVNEQLELLASKNEEKDKELESGIGDINDDVGKVREDVSATQEELSNLKKEAEEADERDEKLAGELSTVKEAVARAEAAAKAPKGKLLYQVTISDDSVSFAFDKTQISEEAKAALDTFAGVLIAENKEIFIEIQGHTDNRGTESYNMELGFARAETVKRYLHVRHGIPLHRMSVISYGESKPVVENKKRSDRAKNRRVVLVVME